MELEKVKARDTADIAVSLLPSDCSVQLPEDLASRWQTEGFDGHPWVTADGDAENPVIPCEELNSQGEAGDDGSDVTVNVYRMVTWYDPDNADCVRPEEADETKQACGMRRITIGARPVDTGPGGKREYREISSDVIDVPESGGN